MPSGKQLGVRRRQEAIFGENRFCSRQRTTVIAAHRSRGEDRPFWRKRLLVQRAPHERARDGVRRRFHTAKEGDRTAITLSTFHIMLSERIGRIGLFGTDGRITR